MTTRPSAQVSLLQQIATFFAGTDTVKAPTKKAIGPMQPTEVEIVTALRPPTPFLNDATEGEEPADLALIELIPAGLSAFNLPHYQETQALDDQIGPACLINACRLEDRPLTEAEMETTELEDLIPAELSKLNIARAKAAVAMKELKARPQPLPDLATLQRASRSSQATVTPAAVTPATLQTAA